jgi:hypothetical protein
MPVGRALLAAYEDYDPLDAQAEVAASWAICCLKPQTPQVLAFINGEIQRENRHFFFRYFAHAAGRPPG